MTTARSLFGLTAGTLSLILVLVAFTAVSAQRRPATTEPSSVTVTLPVQPASAGYVGEER